MKNESIKLLQISFDVLADEDSPLGGVSIYFYCRTPWFLSPSTEIDPSWPSDWPYPELTYEGIVSELHKMKDAGLSLIEMYQAVKALSPDQNQEYWECGDFDRVDILVGGAEDEPEGIWFEMD